MTLPQGWVEATLGDVAYTKLGKMLDATKNKGEPVAYLRNVNVRWGAFDLSDLLEMRVTADEREKLAVRDGDLFMCEGGEPGRCAVWQGGERDLVFQKAIHRVRPLATVYADYIAAFVTHLAAKDGLCHLFTGTTIKHLPQVALQRIVLPLAPADEQHRIVTKLDGLTARLSRARADLNRVGKLVQRLRVFALARLWASTERQTLTGLLAEPIRNGLSVAGSEQPPGQPALRLSALRGTIVNLSDVRYIPINPDRADKYRIEAGDILVSRGNGTLSLGGKASRVGETTAEYPIFPDTAFRLRSDSALVCSEWLLYVWNSPDVRRQIESVARTTAGIWKISQRDLAQIQIPVASLEDQRRMAAAIGIGFARADRLEAEAIRARALLDRLESAILARAFRGELVPQDPNDEPASVLLDRIRSERAAAPKPKRGRARRAVG